MPATIKLLEADLAAARAEIERLNSLAGVAAQLASDRLTERNRFLLKENAALRAQVDAARAALSDARMAGINTLADGHSWERAYREVIATLDASITSTPAQSGKPMKVWDYGLYRSTCAMLYELERELDAAGLLPPDRQEQLESLRAQKDRLELERATTFDHMEESR